MEFLKLLFVLFCSLLLAVQGGEMNPLVSDLMEQVDQLQAGSQLDQLQAGAQLEAVTKDSDATSSLQKKKVKPTVEQQKLLRKQQLQRDISLKRLEAKRTRDTCTTNCKDMLISELKKVQQAQKDVKSAWAVLASFGQAAANLAKTPEALEAQDFSDRFYKPVFEKEDTKLEQCVGACESKLSSRLNAYTKEVQKELKRIG